MTISALDVATSALDETIHGRAMGGLVMMDSFHRYHTLSLGEPGGYLAFPGGAAGCGDLFFPIYSFFMNFLKINLFYLSYWLRLLLIVCGNIESNPFVVFLPIWTSWLWLYDACI